MANQPSWTTPTGVVRGWADGGVWRATGIRHAVADRWALPRPARPDSEIDATRLSPACPQTSVALMDDLLEGVQVHPEYDEDCVRVSVTVPAGTAPGADLPVMVWIHGGSYVTGAGDLPIYDPRSLVTEQQVIVVNVTYRLGLFGYLRRSGVPANIGLHDQISALRWVRDNISSFGGDPDNVTAFGESAGGDAVAHLMISDGARGLFRRAIVQSAPLGLMPGRTRMYGDMRGQADGLAADAPADEVIAVETAIERTAIRHGIKGGMPFGVEYGQAPLPAESDLDAAWSEAAARVDVLIGHTYREAALFVPPRIGGLPLVGPSVREQLVGRLTDSIYARPSRAFIRRHGLAGGLGGHYVLRWGQGSDAPMAGAHTTDLPLVLGDEAVWGAVAKDSGTAWSAFDDAGRQIRAIWGGFAHNGALAPRDDELIEVVPV